MAMMGTFSATIVRYVVLTPVGARLFEADTPEAIVDYLDRVHGPGTLEWNSEPHGIVARDRKNGMHICTVTADIQLDLDGRPIGKILEGRHFPL